jgi:RimK family alpha-L-glutamate ligase
MKIGIFGTPNTIESKWLEEEAQKRGHTVLRFSTNDLIYKVQNNKFTIESPFDLKSIDIFLVRGMIKRTEIKGTIIKSGTEALLFLRYINDVLEKPIVDERLAKKTYIRSKMATFLQLSKANLPMPLTLKFPNKEEALKNINEIPYPIIVKDLEGSKGQDIYKIDTKKSLIAFIKKKENIARFEFQEFLPTDGDIRVLVIGYNKVIGAMKRYLVPGDFRANISQGAKAEKYKLTPEVIGLAKKATEVTNTEFAGVDLIESKGKFYIIEVNRAPQFRGFRKYTGIDPSPFVIDYLEEKFSRK